MPPLIDLIRRRRSIRRYKSDPVPREMIEACIEAARFSPTACNTQSWRFIVTEGAIKERLVAETLGGVIVPNRWAAAAPVIVVVAMDPSIVTHRIGAGVKGIDYLLIDAGIAGEHFVLQAVEYGLGTCWIGWFNKRRVKRLLALPPDWDVAAMIAVGFPEDEPAEKERKSIAEISDFRR